MSLFHHRNSDAFEAVARDHRELGKLLGQILGALRAIGICGAVIVLGTGGFIWSSRATDAAYAHSRAQGRLAQCRIDNQRRIQAGETGRRQAESMIAIANAVAVAQGKPVTDTGVAKAFVDGQAAAAQSVYPHRDCSKPGIDAYYRNPPPADPEPCQPNGKGLCR